MCEANCFTNDKRIFIKKIQVANHFFYIYMNKSLAIDPECLEKVSIPITSQHHFGHEFWIKFLN